MNDHFSKSRKGFDKMQYQFLSKKKNTQLPLLNKKVFLGSQPQTQYSRVKQESRDPQTGIKGGDVHKYV